jgi:hypothetical protein
MASIDYFQEVWNRCDHISAVHGYIERNSSSILQVDEMLRAEWVARVSALDLYVHELILERMLEIFQGIRGATAEFQRFKISVDTAQRIRNSASLSEQISAFELDVRQQLDLMTYQDPEKIADGVRLVSGVELWNEVALDGGASPSTKVDCAKAIKKTLSLIVRRRNKIAHEGDMQPTVPRIAWPIDKKDVSDMRDFLYQIVRSIHKAV